MTITHSDPWSLDQFADLVRRHQAVVCATAFGVTGDRALSEDIAQETFVAAWQNLTSLRDTAKVGPWLRGIARNLARSARRKRTHEPLGEHTAGDDVMRDAIAHDEARVTWAAVRELPEAYREALVLYYWQDQSAREVAESLGISEATAMQRLSRGRSLLREEVQRRVEGTLRRGRPGAALTTAILGAIAAATAKTAGAATAINAAVNTTPLRALVTWKAALTAIVVGALATFGASMAVSSGCTGGNGSQASGSGSVSAAASRPAPARGSALLGEPHLASPPAAVTHGSAGAPGDELDPDGQYMTIQVNDQDASHPWLTDDVRHGLSPCFEWSLADHPAPIDIVVAGGKIASVTVRAFETGSSRVVARTRPPQSTPIAPTDLATAFTDGQPISVGPGDADVDNSLPLHDFVELCAKSHLEGQAAPGPDTTHVVQLTASRFVPLKVDHEAYSDLQIGSGAARGPANAKVTVIMFLDVVDPGGYSAKALAAWNEALADHAQDVRLVVKLCPFKAPGHRLAAEAAYAANAQGALWPMLDLLASNRDHIAIDDLVANAAKLNLDVARFRSDLETHAYGDAIDLDQDQATTMDIHALPSAIVNGKRVHGALPASNYRTAVEAALATAAR